MPEAKARLERFLADGAHGDMTWLATTAERRASPDALWPEVRSVIMLGMNYGPDEDPLAILKRKDRAAISTYAKGDDYHELIKSRLKEVARWLVANAGGDVKVFVDTAAVMEKPLAATAGLGWQGKHTNLVSRQFGSWLFLGSIFTTLELPADRSRSRQLRQLPRLSRYLPDRRVSGALSARCAALHFLSDHRAQGADPARIPRGHGQSHLRLRRLPGRVPVEQVRGAKAARPSSPRATSLRAPALAELARLDDAQFRALFAKTSIKRTGRDRFVRNVLIAIGNAGDVSLAPEAERLLDDASPLVRGAAVWALSRLLPRETFAAMRKTDSDVSVNDEWAAVLT